MKRYKADWTAKSRYQIVHAVVFDIDDDAMFYLCNKAVGKISPDRLLKGQEVECENCNRILHEIERKKKMKRLS